MSPSQAVLLWLIAQGTPGQSDGNRQGKKRLSYVCLLAVHSTSLSIPIPLAHAHLQFLIPRCIALPRIASHLNLRLRPARPINTRAPSAAHVANPTSSLRSHRRDRASTQVCLPREEHGRLRLPIVPPRRCHDTRYVARI